MKMTVEDFVNFPEKIERFRESGTIETTRKQKRSNVFLQVLRVMDKRAELTGSRQADWAMGECLAFLSLVKEGHHVRLSGEDVERGTFSHRIHIIHDQSRDKTYKNILHDVFPGQALYTVTNSSLSEYGVCGESIRGKRKFYSR